MAQGICRIRVVAELVVVYLQLTVRECLLSAVDCIQLYFRALT